MEGKLRIMTTKELHDRNGTYDINHFIFIAYLTGAVVKLHAKTRIYSRATNTLQYKGQSNLLYILTAYMYMAWGVTPRMRMAFLAVLKENLRFRCKIRLKLSFSLRAKAIKEEIALTARLLSISMI